MLRRLFSHLNRDERGVTAIEFGFAMPIMAVMLMGMFDIGFNIYAQSILQGSVQEAARSSALEGTTTTGLDAKVESDVKNVLPNATLTFTRTSYANFEDVSVAEVFTDTDGDGICNNGEPFEDANGNGAWDADRGIDGQGGARDAVLYSASASFKRVFPLYAFVGLSERTTIEGATVLRNQPYDEQTSREPVTENCT